MGFVCPNLKFRVCVGTLVFRISVGPTLIQFRQNSNAYTVIQVPTLIRFCEPLLMKRNTEESQVYFIILIDFSLKLNRLSL